MWVCDGRALRPLDGSVASSTVGTADPTFEPHACDHRGRLPNVGHDQCSNMPTKAILDFYREPGALTSAGKHADKLHALPADVTALATIVQGLVVHQYAAAHYGVSVPEARTSESHIRHVDQMFDCLFAIDPRPLTVARPAAKRLVGVCHHFMLFMTAMLRSKDVPARGRCGFGSYFNPGYYEDHWVCEYWNATEKRWVLVDAQLDENWRREGKMEFDVLDVPRDRFIVAADAWVQCRSGQSDASKYGIFVNEMRGLWFIAGDLIHDVAALNKMEMLPWDVWGAIPKADTPMSEGELAFFDTLAALTRAGDGSFAELRRLYENDERSRVPANVFNAILGRVEAV